MDLDNISRLREKIEIQRAACQQVTRHEKAWWWQSVKAAQETVNAEQLDLAHSLAFQMSRSNMFRVVGGPHMISVMRAMLQRRFA